MLQTLEPWMGYGVALEVGIFVGALLIVQVASGRAWAFVVGMAAGPLTLLTLLGWAMARVTH